MRIAAGKDMRLGWFTGRGDGQRAGHIGTAALEFLVIFEMP